MDRYQRVEKPRTETVISENEIRITAKGLIRNYISYATSLLQDKQAKEIVLKATGQAISKAVAITEILKKNMPGLYQDASISSTSITDIWEPIEEGLVPLEMTRHVSMISIYLSTKDLNSNSPGYQAPAYVEQPKRKPQRQYYQQRQQQPQQFKQASVPITENSYVSGRGRGRGRNSGGRGGYVGYGSGYGGGDYNNGGGDYNNGGGYSGGGGHSGGGYGGGYGNGENVGWNHNWNVNVNGNGRGRTGSFRGAGYERGRGGGRRVYGGGQGYGNEGARGYEGGGGRWSYEGGGGRGYNRGRGRMAPRGRAY